MVRDLNIVATYPVRWTKYKVFRDFIQNFYDSVGFLKWNELFQYEYRDNILSMWIEGIHFNYEWLMHIGASTKTANSESNAGYFGEGFKIASLCALRDFGWNVEMRSDNWMLSVLFQEQKIDEQKVRMLAYDIEETANEKRSQLILSPITDSEFRLFEQVLYAFYYPENPLFGAKIWEGREGAVYERGKSEYYSELPYTRDFGKKGTVFCAYQLLGSNPFNLAICLHRYKRGDRERNSLYSFDVIDVFKAISHHIDAYGAVGMLEKMRRYWNSHSIKLIDIHTWAPVISNLIYKISQSQEMTEYFCKQHPNLLPLKQVYSISDKNRRRQARAWLTRQEKKYLLVQEDFCRLGYQTLEEVCDKSGGFVVNDRANDDENQGFEVLENLVKVLYDGFFEFAGKMPERRIITNECASYHGMVTVFHKNKPRINKRGLFIRYELGEIYLKKSIFSAEGYYDGVATYVHELCHVFGGDASNAFSQGLTHAMEILLINTAIVEKFRKQWRTLFESH